MKREKGLCRDCGEYGHKSHECPKRETGRDQTKFQGKCWYCGEQGHSVWKCKKRKSDEEQEKTGERSMMAYEKESGDIEDYLSDYSGVASLF